MNIIKISFVFLSTLLVISLVGAVSESYNSDSEIDLSQYASNANISAKIKVTVNGEDTGENGNITATINVKGQGEGSDTSGKYIIDGNSDSVQISGGVKVNGGELQTFSGKMDAAKAEVILRMANVSLNLSNGKNASIKVMPSTASATAIAKLGLNTCNWENNCTIEFKETGKGKDIRLVYHVEAQKDAKILFLFKAKMNVNADVDVESGELVSSDKPWWAIIAKE